MRNFLLPLVFIFLLGVTSCESLKVIGGEEDVQSRLTTSEMEKLINNLLSGAFMAFACELYDGDKCIKPFDEGFFGSAGFKFYDYGMGYTMVFYPDKTCRMGYLTSVAGGCDINKAHPNKLYDTWHWSYDTEESTITITAPDLAKAGLVCVTTIVIESYKDGEILIKGALPNVNMDQYSFAYKGRVDGLERRAQFEEEFFDEDDYPCCRQY